MGQTTAKRRIRQYSLRRLLTAITLAAVVLGLSTGAGVSIGCAIICTATVIAVTLLPRRTRNAILVLLPCAYLPYVWLLLMNYPWNSYRWSWIKMWPVLPGLVPRLFWFHQYSNVVASTSMAVATFLFMTAAILIARRGKWSLVCTAAIVLILSVLNAYIAYGVFRAG